MDFDRRNDRSDEVFSKAVKAGKRTYFFDIKSTKGNDLYLTITESKKSTEGGRESFQKHKLFLYKEDFGKFKASLLEIIDKVEELKRSGIFADPDYFESSFGLDDVDFDDL
jgi:hypothetical protein